VKRVLAALGRRTDPDADRIARKQCKQVLDFMVGSIMARIDGTRAPRLLAAGGVA
jgi:hypothetical protein